MNLLSIRSILAILCSSVLYIGPTVVLAHEAAPFPEVKPMEQEEHSSENISEVLSDSIGGYADDSYYLQRIHHDGDYHLVAFSASGDVVQLHDSSKWEIERSGRGKVLYWVQSDNIFIKPCLSWFSSFKYVLYNQTTNQAVEANLINPPSPVGVYTFFIVNIQPYERLVLLSDNTVWQVGPDANFSYWRIGQRVLVGVNNHWRTALYPQILINVDMPGEPYSLANFYGYPIAY